MKRYNKIILCAVVITAFFIFSVLSVFGAEDDYWSKCSLNVNDPLSLMKGSVVRNNPISGGPNDSYVLSKDNISGSNRNNNYGFTAYWWYPFSYFSVVSESTINVEIRLQYEGFAEAVLGGYSQCRRIEYNCAVLVGDIVSYDYTVSLVNGNSLIPLYYRDSMSSSTDGLMLSSWTDFELSPDAYFSISFDIPYSDDILNKPLYLYIYDYGNVIWLENPSVTSDLIIGEANNSLNNSSNKADGVIGELNELAPKPEVNVNDIDTDGLSQIGKYFDTENTVMVFCTALAVSSLGVATIGYILHGKKG